MAPSKIIAILGATGQQGGSIVNTFLEDASTWHIRGITRKKSSIKARVLADRGVEVVEADMSSPSTLDAAFQNANVIFAVSDFLGTYFSPENKEKPAPGQALNAWVAEEEARQLKNVIMAAAKITSLERFVFSSLSNVTKWSKGKYTHVYHFDGKASAEEYGKLEYPELWAKTSVLQAGIFLNTFAKPTFLPRMSANGTMSFVCPWNPDLRFPWLVPDEDTGPLVQALVHDSPGKSLLGYREWASTREIATMFMAISGLKAEVHRASDEQFWANAFSPGLVTEFTEHLQYWEEFGFEAQESPKIIHPSSLSTQVQLPGIASWLRKQSWVVEEQDCIENMLDDIKCTKT